MLLDQLNQPSQPCAWRQRKEKSLDPKGGGKKRKGLTIVSSQHSPLYLMVGNSNFSNIPKPKGCQMEESILYSVRTPVLALNATFDPISKCAMVCESCKVMMVRHALPSSLFLQLLPLPYPASALNFPFSSSFNAV